MNISQLIKSWCCIPDVSLVPDINIYNLKCLYNTYTLLHQLTYRHSEYMIICNYEKALLTNGK